jgi:hypothetical protein
LTLFKWFRRSEQPLGLRDIIANFSVEAASQTFESTAKSDRLASALSIATLFTAGQFSQGVLDHLVSLPKPATQPESRKLSLTDAYDVGVVEAAAFCYFHLLRPYIRDEDQPPQGGHLLRCLTDSMRMTTDSINVHGQFQIPSEFFADRAQYYAKHVLEDEFDKFEETLIDSLVNGRPELPKQFREGFFGEPDFDIPVRLNARIFTGTSLPGLLELSDRLFRQEWDNRL